MKIRLLLAILLIAGMSVFAQPPGSGGSPQAEGGQSAGAKGAAPIGGNILYLLAMGAVYGFYKVKGHLNKEDD